MLPTAKPGCQRRHVASLSLATFVLLAGTQAAQAEVRATEEESYAVERTQLQMGTLLTVRIEADTREAALAASESVFVATGEAEARLSTWTVDSELARLNASESESDVPISAELATDLAATRRCFDLTNGAFDPTVGPLVAAWDLRGEGRVPMQAEIESALEAVGLDGLELSGRSASRRRPDLRLDEGGFGKGAGLDDALAELGSNPKVRSAILDFGGQIVVFRRAAADIATDTAANISLVDPDNRSRIVAEFRVDGGSVATTGNSERGLLVGGRRLGHVLDPRSGRPATDFGSLTVWTDAGFERSATLADCLSTGLYVLGPRAALDFAARHDGIEVAVALRTPNGPEVQASPGLSLTVLETHPETLRSSLP